MDAVNGFEDSAEEAEISLIFEEAGIDEPRDKTTLAAFGTRELKTECVLLKRLLIGSEGRFKRLMRVNDEMGRREKQMKGKVGALEGKRSYSIKLTITEVEVKAKKLSKKLEAFKAKLIETETRIRQSIFQKCELSKNNHDLQGRVNALDGVAKT